MIRKLTAIFGLAGLALLLSAPGVVNAGLISHWNFNVPTGTYTTLAADSGPGLFRFNTPTTNNIIQAGTNLNAVGGDAAGGTAQLLADGQSFQVELDLTGQVGIRTSFAARNYMTGFENGQWSYSVDGGVNFTNLASSDSFTNSFSVYNGNFGSALDNVASAVLRYTVTGGTGPGAFVRFDNLQVSAIPEPTAILMVGSLIGLVGLRRRRS
jgi:hypothetical protein